MGGSISSTLHKQRIVISGSGSGGCSISKLLSGRRFKKKCFCCMDLIS